MADTGLASFSTAALTSSGSALGVSTSTDTPTTEATHAESRQCQTVSCRGAIDQQIQVAIIPIHPSQNGTKDPGIRGMVTCDDPPNGISVLLKRD
jgi:hypothetical protein